MLRAALVTVMLCALAEGAHADDTSWYRGKYGRNRVLHVSITVGLGVSYAATDFLEGRLAPAECRWCDPTGVDKSIRDALRWDDAQSPRLASHIMSFAVAPLLASGLVLLYTPPTWADAIDNVTPIAESMFATLWVTRAIKLAVGRERPYAHYIGPEDEEDKLSFPSGHTSRAFAVAAAAGVIARDRGYASEPWIWGSGAVIGLATGYLRIAADKHYLTDVLSGAALGTAVGLTVPLLMKRDVEVVPTGNGIALAGSW